MSVLANLNIFDLCSDLVKGSPYLSEGITVYIPENKTENPIAFSLSRLTPMRKIDNTSYKLDNEVDSSYVFVLWEYVVALAAMCILQPLGQQMRYWMLAISWSDRIEALDSSVKWMETCVSWPGWKKVGCKWWMQILSWFGGNI